MTDHQQDDTIATEPAVSEASGDDRRHRFWCVGCGARVQRVTEFGSPMKRGHVVTRKVRLCDTCMDRGTAALATHRAGRRAA